MSKTLLAAALLVFIGLGACKKDDDDNPNIPANYLDKGFLKYQNNSGDKYDIYLDDARYGSLYGGASTTYPNITAGTHRVKAIQVEHINGAAIERAQTVFILKDSTATFIFP
jgi:hypothetical protein